MYYEMRTAHLPLELESCTYTLGEEFEGFSCEAHISGTLLGICYQLQLKNEKINDTGAKFDVALETWKQETNGLSGKISSSQFTQVTIYDYIMFRSNFINIFYIVLIKAMKRLFLTVFACFW